MTNFQLAPRGPLVIMYDQRQLMDKLGFSAEQVRDLIVDCQKTIQAAVNISHQTEPVDIEQYALEVSCSTHWALKFDVPVMGNAFSMSAGFNFWNMIRKIGEALREMSLRKYNSALTINGGRDSTVFTITVQHLAEVDVA